MYELTGRTFIRLFGRPEGIPCPGPSSQNVWPSSENSKEKALKTISGLYSGESGANTMCTGTYPYHPSGNTAGSKYPTRITAADNAAEYMQVLIK